MLRYLSILCISTLLSFQLHAQLKGRALTDSLIQRVPYGGDDTNKVNLLNRISRTYSRVNPDTGVIYGQQALNLATDIKWKAGIATAQQNIGVNFQYLNNNSGAMQCFLTALKINEELGRKTELAANLGNIGNVHYSEKRYDKALDYYQQALKINEEQHYETNIASNLGNIANVYGYYYDEAKKASLAHGIAADEAKAQDYKQKALNNYNRAADLYRKLEDKNGVARNLGNAGNLFKLEDDKTEGVKLYKDAVQTAKEADNKMFESAFLCNVADAYISVAQDVTGKKKVESYTARDKNLLLQKSVLIYEEALKLTRETGFVEATQACLQGLSTTYAALGNYKKAWDVQSEYTNFKDSVTESNSQLEVAKLESQHKLEQQDKEIQIKKLEVAQKRNTNIFLIAGMLGLVVVIFFIAKERKKSEVLLLNILPGTIAQRLKRKEHPIADHFSEASILFIDMAGFTQFAERRDPKEIVSLLNEVFTVFDAIAGKHGLEKIKTIGDCYMAVSGLPQPRRDHAVAAAAMALEIRESLKGFAAPDGTPIGFRLGLDSGSVVAGVIGKKKFIYDLWGDPVNTASRMEMTGVIGEVHCTDNFKDALQRFEHEEYHFNARGSVEIKGKGKMQTWLLKMSKEKELVEA